MNCLPNSGAAAKSASIIMFNGLARQKGYTAAILSNIFASSSTGSRLAVLAASPSSLAAVSSSFRLFNSLELINLHFLIEQFGIDNFKFGIKTFNIFLCRQISQSLFAQRIYR